MNETSVVPTRSPFRLRFLGATSTVTGSRYLLQAGSARILVDCGLFQGYKPLRLRNWAPFPVDPSSIDAVVLTHAHLDHSGYLPRLVKAGFRGPVYCTAATRALCAILLPDSGRLLEEEAEHANRVGSSKHHPAEPLYSEADAQASLRQLQVVGDGIEVAPGVMAEFRLQGHILGAAAVCFEFEGTRIVFSGDVGRYDDPVMLAPEPRAPADWVVCESTYGDREHADTNLSAELTAAIAPTLARNGVVVIPAFAVGRAQLLAYEITRLQAEGKLPSAPLYLNSPMASEVTKLYHRFPALHRLDGAALDVMENGTRSVRSVDESKQLNLKKGPMIILSASGMATGGRVLHHLIAFAPDPRNTIVLCGFQAGGTRGAALARGAKTLKIYGQEVVINAEVVQLDTASAHADASELIDWLTSAPPPRGVFLVHGEPDSADAFRKRIVHQLHWSAQVPEFGAEVDLCQSTSA